MNPFDVDRLFEQARSGELVIDCPRMVLSPNWDSNQKLYGAGEIRLDKDRRLQLKMFCHQTPVNAPLGNAGDLICHDQYHSLTATDLKGITWRCEHLYPECTSIGHQFECVISAVLWQIKGDVSSLDRFPIGGNRFASFDEIEVPANRETVTTVESANGKTTSTSYDTWHDSLGVIPIAIVNLRPGILVTCVSVDLAQEDIDSIHESLIFAKATIFQWHFICWDTEEKQHLIINSRLFPQPKARLRPPYNFLISRDVQGVFGRLLKQYYSFCRTMPNKQQWHPVTRHIYSACEGSAGSVDQEMLTLAVVVEGVVNSLFKARNESLDPGPKSAEDHFRDAVESLEKHLGDWKFPEERVIEDSLKKRCSKFFEHLNAKRTVDVLYLLARQGLVQEKEVKAWKSIRHPAAHASIRIGPATQNDLDSISLVTGLLYKLIFHGIGYTGPYTAYSEPGWPECDFTGTRTV